MEERPTRHVYIEILRPATISHNEMDLISDWTEAEAEQGLAQGVRPRDQGTRPPVVPNQGLLIQKLICKHKGLIPDTNVKACQPI